MDRSLAYALWELFFGQFVFGRLLVHVVSPTELR
jgi:hypothetical protein